MMKRLVSVLVLLLATTLVAATAMDASKTMTARGQIVSVDTTEKMFAVKASDPAGTAAELSFILNNESKIVKGGSTIALGGLKAGDTVTVTYKVANNANLVVNVAVEPLPRP